MNNTQDILISFCLPVYNVKEYIYDCIQSIYEQNLSCFEIICVDDGSTDGSREELEMISEKHPEITLIYNESNKGIGYTRNKALQNSRGKYIWFVDADDMLAPNTAKLYLNIAEKEQADAVLGRSISFSASTEILNAIPGSNQYKMVSFSDLDHFYSVSKMGNVCFGVWVGIFRREFLKENEMVFHEDIRALEEITFFVEFGIKAKNVISVDHFGYYYRIRATSASHEHSSLIKVVEAGKTVLCYMDLLCESNPKYNYPIRVNMTIIERYVEKCLVRLSDTGYVRETLLYLKEKGFYPHRCGFQAYMLQVRGGKRIKRIIIYWLLRIEPFFWGIHYVLKVYRYLWYKLNGI